MTRASLTLTISPAGAGFPCESGDNLLRAALRAGVGFPYECAAGGCGTCKYELISGEVRDLWPEAPALTARDRERGRRLACQSQVLGDCTIKARPSDVFVPVVRPARIRASFIGSVAVTRDIREYTFQGPGEARFLCGQFALLMLAGAPAPRAYSMSNQPNPQGLWRFMIRRVDAGRVSPGFERLMPGGTIEIDGPLGIAYWRASKARETVCIAGGSGLAPLLSIANAAAESHVPVRLLYGGRTAADIPVFARWLTHEDRVAVQAAVSAAENREEPPWSGDRCHVHELLARHFEGDMARFDYYLAGPPPMIEATVSHLTVALGVPRAQVHYDRFY